MTLQEGTDKQAKLKLGVPVPTGPTVSMLVLN